jgi:hypothetical protein
MDIELCWENMKGRRTFARRRCKLENIQMDNKSYGKNLWWTAFIWFKE